MRYHLIGAALLAAAVALEIAGFGGGGTTVLAAGVACEVWFWVRLSRRTRSRM